MRIEILSEANEDLINGYHFYERQAPNLGSYFLDSLYSDIDSLLVYVHAVLDCRRNPSWTRRRLRNT
jgi:hypothetical protein